MNHKCFIDESNVCCIEVDGQLWVKEFADGIQKEGRTYLVKFCPECGFELPDKGFFNFLHSPYRESNEPVYKFTNDISTAISQINHNIELMKCFMSSQNTQNKCFMERDFFTSKEINYLKRRLEILEEKK